MRISIIIMSAIITTICMLAICTADKPDTGGAVKLTADIQRAVAAMR